MWKHAIGWSEIGSGLGETGGTPPLRKIFPAVSPGDFLGEKPISYWFAHSNMGIYMLHVDVP